MTLWFKFYKIMIQSLTTYIGNILREDFQPNLEGNGRRVGEQLFDNERSFRMAQSACRGQGIGFQCMPCFQNNLYHADIHPS